MTLQKKLKMKSCKTYTSTEVYNLLLVTCEFTDVI